MAVSIRVPSLEVNPVEWHETRQQRGSLARTRISILFGMGLLVVAVGTIVLTLDRVSAPTQQLAVYVI